MRGNVRLSGTVWNTWQRFWGECFTCDEYPPLGLPSAWERKGRYHSCAVGCGGADAVLAPRPWHRWVLGVGTGWVFVVK